MASSSSPPAFLPSGTTTTTVAASSLVNNAISATATTTKASPTKKPSAALGFLAGGIAACGAVTITNPAEVPYLPFSYVLCFLRRYEGSKECFAKRKKSVTNKIM